MQIIGRLYKTPFFLAILKRDPCVKYNIEINKLVPVEGGGRHSTVPIGRSNIQHLSPVYLPVKYPHPPSLNIRLIILSTIPENIYIYIYIQRYSWAEWERGRKIEGLPPNQRRAEFRNTDRPFLTALCCTM